MGSPSIVPTLASSCHNAVDGIIIFSHTAGETRFFLLLCPNAECEDRGGSEDGVAESVSGFSSKPQEKFFVYITDTPQTPGWD